MKPFSNCLSSMGNKNQWKTMLLNQGKKSPYYCFLYGPVSGRLKTLILVIEKKGKKLHFFLEAVVWQLAKKRKDVSRLNKDQDLPLACKFPLKDNRKSCSK